MANPFRRSQSGSRFNARNVIFGLLLLGVVIIAIGLGAGLHHSATSKHSTSSSSSSSSTSASAVSATASTSATTTGPTNPVKTATTAQFLGNVTSENSNSVRDAGWQGKIGSTYINTYADTVPCTNKTREDCFGLIASNSASTPGDDPESYVDIRVKGHNSEQFCPVVKGEKISTWAIWLSAVVETGSDTGIVFFTRIHRAKQPQTILGGGAATVTFNGSTPICTRTTAQWWDAEAGEPYYGDHGAVLGPDGYIYALGGAGGAGNMLFLTRVLQASGDDLGSYEYWDGTSFTSSRLYNPSANQSVLDNGQGSIIYSPFYEKYLYFSPGDSGGSSINVQAATEMSGPWSEKYQVWGTGNSPDGYLMYAPAVQPRYSDASLSHLVLMYSSYGTGFSNILQAINITFA